MKHELKTWPVFFDAIRRNIKPFEVRQNDRNFNAGDTLVLREWSPLSKDYTGRYEKRIVTYVLEGGQLGIAHGYCVMGIQPKEIQPEEAK